MKLKKNKKYLEYTEFEGEHLEQAIQLVRDMWASDIIYADDVTRLQALNRLLKKIKNNKSENKQ